MSEQAKLLVAVAEGGRDVMVVAAHGKSARHEVAMGGRMLSEYQDCRLSGPGMYIWEGTIEPRLRLPPKPAQWAGTWRQPQADEWDRLARGLPVWEEK